MAYTLPADGVFTTNPSAYNVAQAKGDQNSLLGVVRRMGGGLPRQTYVINGDAITPDHAVIALDTEGGAAADNLKNMLTTNMPDGRIVILSILSSARKVTLQNAGSGSGPLLMAGSVNFLINTTDTWIAFIAIGGAWWEMWRNYGSDFASFRAFIGVPAADTTKAGIIELATGAETIAGQLSSRAVTPASMAGCYGSNVNGEWQFHPNGPSGENGWVDVMGLVSTFSASADITVTLPIAVSDVIAGPLWGPASGPAANPPWNVYAHSFNAGTPSTFKASEYDGNNNRITNSRRYWIRCRAA
jgi:hypothetical protein